MSSPERIPVFGLTGFLGAGKTSLLNALLRDPSFQDSAVVVNEFGEIGIDHLLVSSAKENIVLLDAGCLCCAVLDSLRETLADLYHRRARGEVPPFRRVLIETSGLADPAPILQTLMRDPVVSYLFRLRGLICMVDAVFGADQLAANPEAAAQVNYADRLIVTKTDLAGGGTPAALAAQLDRLNPTAERIEVVKGAVDARRLLDTDVDANTAPPWLNERRAPAPDAHDHAGHDHDHHPRHDAAVGSESFWVDQPATWAGLAAWTDWLRGRYGPALLRCKGLVNVTGVAGPVVLHGVQTMFETSRMPAWPDPERRSRLVLIGRGLDRPLIARSLHLLHAAEGTHPEFEDAAPPTSAPFNP